MVDKWKRVLNLEEWVITSQFISRDQVLFPTDITSVDKFFIGVCKDINKKVAIIYYDRDLTDQDVLHELLHIKFPNEDQDFIDYCTNVVYINNK